jgi:hypothetical protein
LSTIQLCTEKMPFQAPAVPVKMMTRAGAESGAAGRSPALDQSASRHERGSSLNAYKAARAIMGAMKRRRMANMTIARGRRGDLVGIMIADNRAFPIGMRT